jgi:hypothetical protein
VAGTAISISGRGGSGRSAATMPAPGGALWGAGKRMKDMMVKTVRCTQTMPA